MISDIEKMVGSTVNNHIVNLITISVKDVIYQKRKTGNIMNVTDVKMCLLKNVCILKSKELSNKIVSNFENKWSDFIRDLKTDERVKRSWYVIG